MLLVHGSTNQVIAGEPVAYLELKSVGSLVPKTTAALSGA